MSNCIFLKGHGFWFVYPNEPLDASEGLGMMDLYEAMHTAIFEFDNNVAHSNVKVTHVITWYLKSRNCLNLQLVVHVYIGKKLYFVKKK